MRCVLKGLYPDLSDDDLIAQKGRKGGPGDEREDKERDGAVGGGVAMEGGP